MKTEIIPTILVKSFNEVKERIKAVENYVNWVHLDVMDGVFVYNETWPHSVIPGRAKRGKAYSKEIEKLKKINPPAGGKIKLEVHLMVEKPEEEINDWLKVAERIIIHFESKITNRELGIRELIKKVHKKGKEFGLALNPETHPAVVTPFLKDLPCTIKDNIQASGHRDRAMVQGLDLVLFMTVQPGWGGQEFKEWTLTKVEVLRKLWPDGNIEVDGGMNPETATKAIKAGANLICAGTYIFRSKNIEEAINNFKKLI